MTHLKMDWESRRNKLAEQYLKQWPSSLVNWETQITLLFHLTLVRMAKINKTTNAKCW